MLPAQASDARKINHVNNSQASSVACLETISWIPLDYPNADKPFSQVKK